MLKIGQDPEQQDLEYMALYLVFHINSQISSYKCFIESKLLNMAIV